MNKISIVTVTWNNHEELLQTIKTVKKQKQNGASIEYLVIDGGSTDGTLDVVQEYKDTVDFFLSEKDDGLYDAMNKGMEKATGDSILFLNSGDYFYDGFDLHKFQKKYDVAEKVILCRTIQTYKDHAYLRPRRGKKKYSCSEFGHQGVFAPKKLYKKHHYDLNYKIAADLVWMEKLWATGSFEIVDDVCAVFSLGGLSNAPSVNQVKMYYSQPSKLRMKILATIKLVMSMFVSRQVFYKLMYGIKYEKVDLSQER